MNIRLRTVTHTHIRTYKSCHIYIYHTYIHICIYIYIYFLIGYQASFFDIQLYIMRWAIACLCACATFSFWSGYILKESSVAEYADQSSLWSLG